MQRAKKTHSKSGYYGRATSEHCHICRSEKEEMGKFDAKVAITMGRFLAGLSCEEGESVGAFWNEWLDWGLFNWLLWCCWSFLKKH